MKLFVYIKVFFLAIFTNRPYWRVRYKTGSTTGLIPYGAADILAGQIGGKAFIDYKFIIINRRF